MLQYSETVLPLVESLWVMAQLEACDVTNNGRQLGRHLGFYQESRIRNNVKTARNDGSGLYMKKKTHINKHFA